MVDVFDSSGAYITQFGGGSLFAAGVAVDEASGDVYVADTFENAVLVFKPEGAGGYALLSEWFGERLASGEFGEVAGVAVDNSSSASSGDLYVVDSEDASTGLGAVDVFKPKSTGSEEDQEGSLVRVLSAGKMEAPSGVAVSRSSGRVLVADGVKGAVYAFDATGSLEEKLTGKGSPYGSFKGKEEEEGNVAAVAVDEGTGDFYVAEAERHAVSQYSPAGIWEGWVMTTPSESLGEPRGVGLTASGNLYVADAGLALVDVFGPGVVVPDVETGKDSKTTRTTAVVGGTINGDGKPAKYRFQYGEGEALGFETSSQAAGPGEEKVSATLEGLHAGRTYHFRLLGENENGSNYGVLHEFTTPPAVEGVSSGLVANLKPSSATLTGKLTPGGFDAHYYFEWGLTMGYGNSSPNPPGADAGAGMSPVEATTGLSGLSPNALYHYRIVTENSFGVTYGADQHFTTSGPPRITSEPTTGIGHEEATIHAKVNPDQIATTYHFEYGETAAYGSEVPVGGASLGSGSEAVPVSANLSGLKLGVTYHFRVVAENEADSTIGPDQKFTTIPPAPVDATYATNITPSGATLHTQINPLGNDTTFYFQYGTQSCQANPGACTNAPSPSQDIGGGETDVEGKVQLSGLEPSTTYHYRVLATNSLGTTEGAERTFTTQEPEAVAVLPDGRAWEMVSPPDKQGAPVEGLTREGGLILASEDGDKLTYVVDGALGEEVQGNRSPEWQQVIATRSSSGWSSQDVATPSSKPKGITAGQAPEYQFFTPDLSVALVEPAGQGAEPPLAPGVTQATMYLRDNATGGFLPLVTNANVAPGTQFGAQLEFLSATPDLSHVVITSAVALTGARSAPGLYEWSEGNLQFVSVLPGGVAANAGELGLFDRVLVHAISSDGSRIVWTNKEDLTTRGGHLFMRDTVTGETLQLDAAQGVVEPAKGAAQFQGASSDGSRVFFTDRQPLTTDSTAEAGQGNGKDDLYECVIAEVAGKLVCNLRDLTVDQNEGEHAAVQGFLFGMSDNGTSGYLVAQGVLATNENGNGEKAEPAKNNLYELHFDGSKWSRTFIATLSSEDAAEWEGKKEANTAFLTARVSPNGRYLAFMSAASATGYDNIDQNSGQHDEEVYLYDSLAASLRCVSCNPTGARPAGVLDTNESGEGLGLLVDRRRVWLGHWLAGNIPGWTAQSLQDALYQSRYLSDNGRLYFNSPDTLVPAASNGQENVYQYEPTGTGGCASPSGGCVSLISGGNSGHESAFIEATPSGSDVFFVTESRLLAQDTDTAFDIYDARECSQASPCLTPPEPAPAACASTDACRPAPPAQQIPGAGPATMNISGRGNIVPTQALPKQESRAVKKAAEPLTRAQKLSKAIKSCRRQHKHAKKKRAACERKARKRYGSRKVNQRRSSQARRDFARAAR